MKLTLLLLLLLQAPLFADDIRFAPGVTVTAAVTLVADADGVLQIDRKKPILVGSVGGTPPVDPTEPDDPTDPTEPTDHLKLLVSALMASAPTGASEANARKTMAGLYSMTGKLPLSDPAQIRQATTILFDALPLSDGWKAWKGGVDSFAAGLDIADTKRAWQLIAEGLGK